MPKNTLSSLAVLTLVCGCAVQTLAQYDSSRLDAGYLSLKKEFSQTVTINGSDLEKMPFANLSDAIGAWLYGAYTQPGSLQYIVDGNPVSDVNAYSIYDVEEVVLVQSAAALVATAGGQQELVLIRTRRGKGRIGLTAVGQVGLVNASGNGVNTDTRVYHNYYVGAWRNLDKISVGISGNYLRDVFPQATNGIVTPNNLQRWRLNGYLTWRPDSRNQIDLTINYTPERLAAGQDTLFQAVLAQYRQSADQHFFLPHVYWHSDLLPGLKNDFQASYVTSKYTNNVLLTEGNLAGDSIGALSATANLDKSNHLWFRDRLSYVVATGGWRIEPAINLSYEHLNEQEAAGTFNENALSGGIPIFGQSQSESVRKTGIFLVTPAIELSYKRALDFQAGVMIGKNDGELAGKRGVFPFAGLSLDLLRMGNDNSGPSLKIFGSYARRIMPPVQNYALTDLVYQPESGSVNTGISFTGSNTGGFYVFTPPVIPAYWVWEMGAAYTGWKDRLLIQYNFEQRNFSTTGLIAVPTGNNFSSFIEGFPGWRSALHHADVRVKFLEGAALVWESGINVTLLRSKVDSDDNTAIVKPVGDIWPNPYSWTGGWVNRVEVRDFTAGLDLLYHFGETVGNGGATSRRNSMQVPNIYIGYRWHLVHGRTLEFFLESRGLIRSGNSDLPDQRRYYTTGGKLSL